MSQVNSFLLKQGLPKRFEDKSGLPKTVTSKRSLTKRRLNHNMISISHILMIPHVQFPTISKGDCHVKNMFEFSYFLDRHSFFCKRSHLKGREHSLELVAQ